MLLRVRYNFDPQTLARRTWLLRNVQAKVRAVSFALERRIKLEMPVDTGRARASWGNWSGGLNRPNPDANAAADPIWQEDDDGLSIRQGSNVGYIEQLNAGHSRQAPAGFLDLAEEWAAQQLDQEIANLLNQW